MPNGSNKRKAMTVKELFDMLSALDGSKEGEENKQYVAIDGGDLVIMDQEFDDVEVIEVGRWSSL